MKDRAIKSGRRKPDVEPVPVVVEAPTVAEGTHGFQSFGEGTPAVLNGVEPVVETSDDEPNSAPVPEHIPNRFLGIL